MYLRTHIINEVISEEGIEALLDDSAEKITTETPGLTPVEN